MVNNRTFYAIQQVAIKDNASAATNATAPLNAREYASGLLAADAVDEVAGLWEVPRGLQSISMSTNFNRETVFQLGQVELFEYSERQPDIEVTMEKIIDGTKPLWFMLTDPSFTDLVGKTAFYRSDLCLNIYSDSKFRAGNVTPQSACLASGMYLSTVSYTFPADGAVTESVTLVGNDKKWANFDATLTGESTSTYPPSLSPPDNETPVGVPSGVFGHEDIGGLQELAGGTAGFGVLVVGSGVQRREEVELRRSVLPADIPGVTTVAGSGVTVTKLIEAGLAGDGVAGAVDANGNLRSQLVANANTANVAEHLQNVTISADIGRDDIFELGSKRPFTKYVTFPVEVTTSIEVITSQGDYVDATSEVDCGPDQSANSTIIMRTCDGLQIDCGDTNVLTSVEYGGGEAGGDNVTVTYNYSSFNSLTVSHDRFHPNHRTIVFEAEGARFNVGAAPFPNTTDDVGA
jgi:hypothetical protein